MKKSIAILIDAANFYTTARKLGFDIDYAKLLLMFDHDIHKAIFFTGLPPPEVSSGLRNMVHWMSTNGYVCVTKVVKSYANADGIPRIKANMDVEIACEGMQLGGKVDEVHLFSGDGDFCYLVQKMQDRGAKVIVYSSIVPEIAEMASMDLRKQADIFIDINDIKDKLMKFRTHTSVRVQPKRAFWGKTNG